MKPSDIAKILNEAKASYALYHPSYTQAIDTALGYADKLGYTTDAEERASLIGMGPRKPGKGQTVSLHIPLYKDTKLQKKVLHIQVFNRGIEGNTYELNCYIS
jgi:hypothetical protein